MKHQISIPFRGITYEVTVSEPAILRIRKVLEDSGIERDVSWEELSTVVQERILEKMKEEHD